MSVARKAIFEDSCFESETPRSKCHFCALQHPGIRCKEARVYQKNQKRGNCSICNIRMRNISNLNRFIQECELVKQNHLFSGCCLCRFRCHSPIDSRLSCPVFNRALRYVSAQKWRLKAFLLSPLQEFAKMASGATIALRSSLQFAYRRARPLGLSANAGFSTSRERPGHGCTHGRGQGPADQESMRANGRGTGGRAGRGTGWAGPGLAGVRTSEWAAPDGERHGQANEKASRAWRQLGGAGSEGGAPSGAEIKPRAGTQAGMGTAQEPKEKQGRGD